MDLSQDFIKIQGIFINLSKEHGDFTKIKYRGGNERVIESVILELRNYLASKYNRPNPCLEDELYQITFFLILNTDLKARINNPDYAHLTGIMPQLCKCLLSNIILALDLGKYFSKSLELLKANVIEELLSDLIPYLKKCKPQVCLEVTHEILQSFIDIIKRSSEESEEDTEKLTELAGVMLLNLTSVNENQLKNIQRVSVYKMIGWSANYLFNLLMKCDIRNPLLTNLIGKLLNNACTVLMSVTMDVYISWVEIPHNKDNLQTTVAEKAFEVCEKYLKYDPAQDLLSMLKTIARKPRSLEQKIQESNITRKIDMIREGGPNQKQWFKSLLNNRQVLENKEIIKCLMNYPHLCTMEDVVFLLDLSVGTKEFNVKNVVIKCAATLDFDNLSITNARYFHKNGVAAILNDDIQQQTILIFNKLQQNKDRNELGKDIQLLLLQNPKMLLKLVFQECVKNTFFSQTLKVIFPSLKEIAMIDNLGMQTLQNVIQEFKPTVANSKNYIELLNILLEVEFFTRENIILETLFSFMQNSEENEELRCYLSIINGINVPLISLTQNSSTFFNFLFDLMKRNRCLVVEFEPIKQDILNETIDVITKCSQLPNNYNGDAIHIDSEDKFTSFYQKKLLQSDYSASLLEYLYPYYKMGSEGVIISTLMKILPRCVTSEWISITSTLFTHLGVKAVEILCDLLTLLCQVIESQQNQTEELQKMTNALRSCLRNFGISFKETIKNEDLNLEDDTTLAVHICGLLKHIPHVVRKDLGLTLAQLISDRVLKTKRIDKQFASLIASIKDPCIVQMLAQRTLS